MGRPAAFNLHGHHLGGEYDADQTEFLLAVEAYRKQRKLRFPKATDYLNIAKRLGYAKRASINLVCEVGGVTIPLRLGFDEALAAFAKPVPGVGLGVVATAGDRSAELAERLRELKWAVREL